jgi:Domain of unknown function (DUF6265)
MKKLVIIILAITTLSFKDNDDFAPLCKLQGSWEMKTKKGIMGETWIATNEHCLSSKAYFVKGNDTSLYEKVVLEKKKGNIYFTATSATENDKQPIAFKLTSATANKFVFENAKHDFPKRIVYEFINNDSIHAYIDDGKNNSAKRSHFNYSRIKP